MKCWQRFLERKGVAAAVERAALLALVIAVCFAPITTLGQKANTTFGPATTGLGR